MQLSLQHIVPTYLATRLHGVSSPVWGQNLTFPPGSFILIQAPSGTGKTTFVHILYGLNHNFSGALQWNNLDPASADDGTLSSLRTKELSVIFQDMRLFPQLTAWENIELKRAQTGTVPAESIANWMQQLGIADKKDAPVAKLSFGEQQRVSIIRALAQPFRWLLMDEPFSHLDNANRTKAAALIIERVRTLGAGLILADLEPNDHFPYSQILQL